jgi:chitin disaccharide deacetylase
MREEGAIPTLVISADDYGYRPSYNRGILEAARAGAVDAVSAMVEREFCDPEPLLETGVEVGLHLELAGTPEPDGARAAALTQLDRFERVFGRPAEYLDGHNHCHAASGAAAAIAGTAAERGVPVRSVSDRHRRLLRDTGVATADRLVGRLTPSEPALPELLAAALQGSAPPPPGVTEWMVHPGYRDPERASSFDAAREQDLELLLDLAPKLEDVFRRTNHGALRAER